MASIRAGLATLTATKAAFARFVLCFIPMHSTSYLLARSVLDGSFDDVVMNRAWRRQRGVARRRGPLRQKPGVDDWLASHARP